jgi:hypothetical protein
MLTFRTNFINGWPMFAVDWLEWPVRRIKMDHSSLLLYVQRRS